eukprot:GHVS01083629.1.p1 GENE.GHVS01083629.1~~GHVS01083629.1.p1  ORF type:complete len:635 (-),score=105.53 GHVS01083629.1:19-1923(-)
MEYWYGPTDAISTDVSRSGTLDSATDLTDATTAASSSKKPYHVLFEIGTTTCEILGSTLNSSGYSQSGLAAIVKKKGWKDIPPALARNHTNGAYVLTAYRHPLAFGIMVSFITGDNPLHSLPLSDVADAYIALKSELCYWDITPSEKVRLPIRLWTRSSYCDELCFYPLSFADVKAVEASEEKVSLDAPLHRYVHLVRRAATAAGATTTTTAGATTSKKKKPSGRKGSKAAAADAGGEGEGEAAAKEQQEQEQEEEESTVDSNSTSMSLASYIDGDADWDIMEATDVGIFASNGSRFICKLLNAKVPSVVYGKFGKPGGEGAYSDLLPFVLNVGGAGTDVLVVWNLDTFIHVRLIKVDGANGSSAMQQLCQTYIFTPPPEETKTGCGKSWLCFHPSLGVLLSSHVSPVPHVYALGAWQAGKVKFTPWGAIVLQTTVEVHGRAKAVAGAAPGVEAPPKPPLKGGGGDDQPPPAKALMAYVMRVSSSGVPLKCFSVFAVTTDEKSFTLRQIEDFDIIDRRLEDGRFQVSLLVGGSLASRITDSEGLEDYVVFVLKASSTSPCTGAGCLDSSIAQGITVRSGAPTGEMLSNFYTFGEFNPQTALHTTYDIPHKLLKYRMKKSLEDDLTAAPDRCAIQ